MVDAKKKPSSSKAPWDQESPHGHDATAFVGGPKKPNPDESSVLLLDARKPYIAVSGGPGKGKQLIISADRVILGRENPVDLLVEDKAASRRHAQVYRKNGKWYLKDLGSTNGTYLDGPLRGAERPLWDGDVFKIGDWEFTFSDPGGKRR